MNIWRHLRALAPVVMVLIIVPGSIVYLTAGEEIGWGPSGPLRLLPPVIGGGLTVIGLVPMGWTAGLFATAGQGTPAPWDPPQRLVVHGPYRHVRNPMVSGALSVLLGEAAVLGSLPLLYWFFIFLLWNAVYIPLVEEHHLESRFGDDYRRYRQNVPRWIPRVKPWRPNFDTRDTFGK